MIGNVKDKEIIDAYSVPSIVCNRFLITMNEESVRISFGERIDINENTYFRSAIVISKKDAIQLHELLGQLLVKQNKIEETVI